jgi:hypothetical protein
MEVRLDMSEYLSGESLNILNRLLMSEDGNIQKSVERICKAAVRNALAPFAVCVPLLGIATRRWFVVTWCRTSVLSKSERPVLIICSSCITDCSRKAAMMGHGGLSPKTVRYVHISSEERCLRPSEAVCYPPTLPRLPYRRGIGRRRFRL